jgi:hypothetical protein
MPDDNNPLSRSDLDKLRGSIFHPDTFSAWLKIKPTPVGPPAALDWNGADHPAPESMNMGGPNGSPQWQGSANPASLTGPDRQSWDSAVSVARGILDASIPDPTGGATMFLPATVYRPGAESTAPKDFRRMFTQQRLAPSLYKSPAGKNYFFIERPAPK